MDFFAHTVAERTVHELMLLHFVFAAKRGADNHGFKVMAIAADLQPFAIETFCDIRLHLFGLHHTYARSGIFGQQFGDAVERRQTLQIGGDVEIANAGFACCGLALPLEQ